MKTRRDGFTLIELLTVIAIIAILAAILLPVMGRAREQGRRTSCMSNLHQIAVALKMYKQDCRGYPLGLRERGIPGGAPTATMHWFGSGTDADGNGVADTPDKQMPGYGIATLFPDYVQNAKVFNCPNNDVSGLNDGAYYAASSNSYSAFNSYDGVDPLYGTTAASILAATGSCWKYDRKPWDTAAYSGGSAVITRDQARRMLQWRNPAEDTVITWCSQHRSDATATTPRGSDLDMIVYLDGSTKTVKSNPGTGEPGHQSNAAGSQ